MDFNQVRYFLALSKTLNFTRAAEQCFVTQPALTQAIKRLEDELGGILITRTGRSMELTELGCSLLSQFDNINNARTAVKRLAKSLTSSESTKLNVGVSCTIGPSIVAKVLSEFQKNNPHIGFVIHDVRPEDIDSLMLSGCLDASIRAGKFISHKHINNHEIYSESMVVMFPRNHRFAKCSSISLQELVNEKIIVKTNCEYEVCFKEYYQGIGVEPNVVVSCTRDDLIQKLVSDGLGICISPMFNVLKNDLEIRPITDCDFRRSVQFSFVNGPSITPSVSLLRDFIEKYQP